MSLGSDAEQRKLLDSAHTRWPQMTRELHGSLYRMLTTHTEEGVVIPVAANDMESYVHAMRREYFEKLSLKGTEQRLSRTDVLFSLQCYELFCTQPEIRRLSSATDVASLAAQLCLLACRHLPGAANRSIDPTVVDRLRRDVACWVVRFGSIPSDQLISALTQSTDSESRMQLSDSVCRRLVDAMFVPHLDSTLTRQELANRSERKVLEAADKAAKEHGRLGADPSLIEEYQIEEDLEASSQRGHLWLIDAPDRVTLSELPVILNGFVPLASRIFHQIDTQIYILSIYPRAPLDVYDVFNYTPAARERLIERAVARCQLQSSDTFARDFRMFALGWYLPMGATLECERSIETRGERRPTEEVFSNEIGFDPTQAIGNMLRRPLGEIAKNPQHEMYEILIFYAFASLFCTDSSVDFLRHYCVLPVDMGRASTLKRLRAKTCEVGFMPRRPVLIQLLGDMYIHDQGVLFKCQGVIDALLRFLMIMRKAWCMNPRGVQRIDRNKAYYNNIAGVVGAKQSIAGFSNDILGEPLAVDLPTWTRDTMLTPRWWQDHTTTMSVDTGKSQVE